MAVVMLLGAFPFDHARQHDGAVDDEALDLWCGPILRATLRGAAVANDVAVNRAWAGMCGRLQPVLLVVRSAHGSDCLPAHEKSCTDGMHSCIIMTVQWPSPRVPSGALTPRAAGAPRAPRLQEVNRGWSESPFVAGNVGALSPEARDLLDRIFVVDPARRITVPQIMRHPWCARCQQAALSMRAPRAHLCGGARRAHHHTADHAAPLVCALRERPSPWRPPNAAGRAPRASAALCAAGLRAGPSSLRGPAHSAPASAAAVCMG